MLALEDALRRGGGPCCSKAGAPRVNIMGVGVHAVNMSRVVSLIEGAVAGGGKHYVCATGVHGIMEAQKDDDLRSILNTSFLTFPDGMPTVWVGRLRRHAQMAHVGGPELMLEVCRASQETGRTHFLFGGRPGIVESLSAELRRMFPEIKIAGTYTPPFRELNQEEQADLARRTAEAAPDFFWVGISTPKQEKFMFEYLPRLETKVMIGVGAAFDFHSGAVKLAPLWMRGSGLAWLYRLRQEPRRLWKRYLFNIPRFLCCITLQLIGLRSYEIDGSKEMQTERRASTRV